MQINKIGQAHIDYGMNCQDMALIRNGIKVVSDGCSEAIHSEVGAKLFCMNIVLNRDVDDIFNELIKMSSQSVTDLKDLFSFTFLVVRETDDEFLVYYCGDGYIIKHTMNDVVDYEQIDSGVYPEYFIYNYMPKDSLLYYKEGVVIKEKRFSKSDYKNIGVATDGIRYFFENNLEYKLTECIVTNAELKLKRFINANQTKFKDDIGIAI